MQEEIKKGTAFFSELSKRLRRGQIDCGEPEVDHLPVLLDGNEVGVVTPSGAMQIRKEAVDDSAAGDLIHRAGTIAAEVKEYMILMDAAPPLQASGLEEP